MAAVLADVDGYNKEVNSSRGFQFLNLQLGISERKAKVFQCSFFFVVSLITYIFVGLKSIPHVVIFLYMFQAATRMIAPAFWNVASVSDHDKNSGSGCSRLAKVFRCPFKAYSFFLIACYLQYSLMGGDLTQTTLRKRVAYISCILEGYGLVSLLHKIRLRGHVQGLSGMSIIMFTFTYSIREVEAVQMIGFWKWVTVHDIFLELLQVSSMILSFIILWQIFKTYRASYEADLDVMKVRDLIAGCFVAALVLHPEFRRGYIYSFFWAVSFYIDVLALLPQVIMMQRGNGKVEVPIAHFVAATAVSRTLDLLFWYDRWQRGELKKYLFDSNLSWIIIVVFHLVSFALVGDFMYYYFKWRFSGARMAEHIEIPAGEDSA